MTARKIRKTEDRVKPSHTPRKLKKGDQSVDKKSKEKKPSSGASYQLSPWTRSWQVGVTHRGIYSGTFSVHVYHEYGAEDKETRGKGMTRGNEIIRVAADVLNATRNGTTRRKLKVPGSTITRQLFPCPLNFSLCSTICPLHACNAFLWWVRAD